MKEFIDIENAARFFLSKMNFIDILKIEEKIVISRDLYAQIIF